MLVRPFAALRPSPAKAAAVIAPPYDVVDIGEARELAAGRPESFLHISRPEIDLAPGTDPYSDAVYARGAENLRRLCAERILEREAQPCYYVYRMATRDHVQTGLAATASISAYENARIHRHELTRPAKEDDRVRHIESLNAQTGPVLLTYRAEADVDGALAAQAAGPPLLKARGQHDVWHSVWRIDDAAAIASLTEAVAALGDLYIADGHHRSAAAQRVAAARRGAAVPRDASHEFFLCVAFPDEQMQVFDYNRVVADLNGLSPARFAEAVAARFQLEPVSQPVKPQAQRQFGMYLAGQWYRLEAPPAQDSEDPVARLDVSLLQNELIGPILGIDDPRSDARIDFVGGVRGLAELERRVDDGRAAAAFALYPTSLGELMSVADAGRLMPPKSTWFEPKLADGLLTHVLD